MRSLVWIAWCAGVISILEGQTRLDLGRQARNVDFSGADVTKPFRSGTELPATCSAGEGFFKIDAPEGMKLHLCVSANTWRAVGEEMPSASGNAGKVLASNGTGPEWRSAGGDVTGPIEMLKVERLQGRAVAGETPLEGDVLSWSGVRGQWEPQPRHEAGAGVVVSERNISIDGAIIPNYFRGEGSPTLGCVAGRDYYVDTTNEDLYYCGSDSVWRLASKAGHGHTAEEIQGGVLGLARGGTNQANWVAGRCVQVSSDGSRLESAPGTCSAGSFNPVEDSTLWIREEFASRSTSSNSIGTHGWTSSCAGGTVSYSASGATNKRTFLSLATGAASGNLCMVQLGATGTTATFLGALFGYSGWSSLFRFSVADTTDVYSFVGYMVNNFGSTSARCGLEFDSSRDTDFMFACSTGSNETRVSTGVTVDTAWHTLRMWADAPGVITFQLDNGTPQSISTNVATSTAVSPTIGSKTQGAAAKTIRAYRFLHRGPYVE